MYTLISYKKECIHRFINESILNNIMTAFKYEITSKFGYCSECWSRINRTYQREKNTGVFKGFGFYCNECNELTIDKNIITFDDIKFESEVSGKGIIFK